MPKTVAEGQTAPTFQLGGADGHQYSLTDALSKGPVLAVFFKVTCPTCQFTLPFIERLYRQFAAQGIQVWGISQDVAEEAQRFAKQFGVTFPVLLDEEPHELSQEYRLVYVPTLFLINSDRRIEISGDGFSKRALLGSHQWFSAYFHTTPPDLFLPGEHVPEYKPG